MAMEIMFGIAGIGLPMLLFVILGNPAAGTDAARSAAYFAGADTARTLWILAAYKLISTVAALVGAALIRPQPGGRMNAAPTRRSI